MKIWYNQILLKQKLGKSTQLLLRRGLLQLQMRLS